MIEGEQRAESKTVRNDRLVAVADTALQLAETFQPDLLISNVIRGGMTGPRYGLGRGAQMARRIDMVEAGESPAAYLGLFECSDDGPCGAAE